jgi:hypothetical protein
MLLGHLVIYHGIKAGGSEFKVQTQSTLPPFKKLKIPHVGSLLLKLLR